MKSFPPLSSLRLSAWPADKRVLTVLEIAHAWRATDRHITGLIESGDLLAIDISAGGRFDSEIVSRDALREIARRMGVSLETVIAIIKGHPRRPAPERRHMWRIPTEEGYMGFIRNQLPEGDR